MKKEKKNGKKVTATVEVPVIDPAIRADALDSYLSDILRSKGKSPSISNYNARSQMQDAVVHIFSHVCHTMWVECCKVDAKNEDQVTTKWKVSGQEVMWMTESDMNSVGITSGVRKVLAKEKKKG